MTTQLKPMTPAEIAREIQRRNRLFKGATRAEQRVLIAKDVIEQLKIGRIRAQSGVFIEGTEIETIADDIPEVSLQKTLLSAEEPCNTCALGSLMVSCTLFNNQVNVGDTVTTEGDSLFVGDTGIGDAIFEKIKIANGLNTIFSRKQLMLIEAAFEGGQNGYFGGNRGFDDELSEEQIERATEFSNESQDEAALLTAIMQNIIDNKGTFKP